MAIDLSGKEEEPISLEDAPQDPIDLGTPATSSVDPAAIKDFAKKYRYGLGPYAPSPETLEFAMISGEEPTARENAVAADRVRQREIRNNMAKEYILSRPVASQTPEDIKTIYDLTDPNAAALNKDPATFFEKEYASRLVREKTAKEEFAHIINSAPPEYVKQATQNGESALAIREIAKKIQSEIKAERTNMGWGGFLADLGESMIPLTSWAKQSGTLPGGPAGSLWLGSNLEAQAMALYRMSPEDAEKALRRAVNLIKSGNPDVPYLVKPGNILDVSNYIDYMTDPSTMNKYLNNFSTLMDLSIVAPGIGAIPYAAYRGGATAVNTAAKQTAFAINDIVKGAARAEKFVPPKIAEAAGDIPNAGLELALTKIEERAAQAGSPTNIDSLAGELKTIINPRAVVTQSENALSSENQLRMIKTLEKQATQVLNKGFADPLNINRLQSGSKAIGAAADETLALWERQYPALADSVLNVRPWEATQFERSAATNTAKMEQVVVDSLEALKNMGKQTEYFDYLIHTTNIDTVNMQLGRIVPYKANPRSPDFKGWKAAAKAVESLEAEDTIKASLRSSLDKLESMSPTARKLYFNLSNTEMNLSKQPKVPAIPPKFIDVYKDPLANVDYLGIKLGKTEVVSTQLGHPHTAAFFGSAEEAEMWAKDLFQLKEYRIGQHGTGFYVEVFKALDETSPTVRRALAQETKTKESGITSRIFGNLVSADYVLPKDLASDRRIAVFGTSALAQAEKNVIDSINKIPRSIGRLLGREGSRKDFQDFLRHQRVYKNADRDTPGKFSVTQGDLEKDFHDFRGRMPTYDESLAYWSYVQMYETEFGLKNLAIFRDKSRLGWEMHDFGFGPLEGKFHAAVPNNIKEDFGVYVIDKFEYNRAWGGGKRDGKVITKEAQFEYFDKLVGEGYRTVQLTKFAQRDLKKAAKEMGFKLPDNIDFIMVKGRQGEHGLVSTPLQYQQIPYRPGGHHTYDAEFYIRQPVLRTSNGVTTYYEDVNIAGFKNIAQAQLFEKRFNTAREMFLNRATDEELAAYLRKNLPYSLNSFKRQFDPERGGTFDINTKFYVTHADQSVDAAHNLSHVLGLKDTDRFRRAADSDLNMYKNSINLKYAGERGDTLQTIAQSGSKENPIFKFDEASMLDPLPALDRSMSAAMRGRYIEDLKFKTAEEFAAAFGDMLSVTPAQLQQNPMRWLYEAPFREGLDLDRLARAKNFRRASLEFFGMRTEMQKEVDWLINKIGGSIWNKKGEKEFQASEPWLQASKTDPVDKIRSAVFDLKMAWNPVQAFKQASQLAIITGIEGPMRAGKVFPAASWTQFLRYYGDDPKTLEFVASAVAKFHTPGVEKVTSKAPQIVKDVIGDMGTGAWNKEHFMEAYEGMKKTGFSSVGHEFADAADFVRPNIVEGKLAGVREGYMHFMDFGRGTFRAGERFSRDAAWMAAYDKWRMTNPKAVFDDDAIRTVLERADLLNGRMSAASTATYQRHPVTTLGTQFLGWQLRLFESVTSGLAGRGQLTRAEASRLLLVNSALYGVPSTIGMLSLGFPAYEMIKKAAMEKGIDTDSDPYMRYAMEGGVNEVMRNLIENRPGYSSSTNVAEAYGPGNMTFLQDIFSRDKTPWQIAMGVSGSTLGNIMNSLEPFGMYLTLPYREGGQFYDLKTRDFDAVFSNVSGYNAATRLVLALNVGKYFSKSGLPIDEITKTEAWMKTLLGVEPQRVSDIHKMNEINRDLAEVQRKQLPFVRMNFQAMMEAFSKDDDESAHRYAIRMKAHIIAGGWREDQKQGLFREITKGAETQVQEMSRKFSMATPQRLEAFMKRLQRNQ